MRPAEKETLRAGIIQYLESEVRKHTRILQSYRFMSRTQENPKAHVAAIHQGLGDRVSYIGCAKAQVMVLRRARIVLDIARAHHQLTDQSGNLPYGRQCTCPLDEPEITDAQGTDSDTVVMTMRCKRCKVMWKEEWIGSYYRAWADAEQEKEAEGLPF